MRHRRHGLDIQNIEHGIADGFTVYQTSAGSDGAPEIFRVVRIYKRCVDSQPPEAYVELGIRAAVQILRCDDFVAHAEQVSDGDKLRRLPARQRQSSHAALEGRHSLLEYRGSGIHDAGINVAESLQVE